MRQIVDANGSIPLAESNAPYAGVVKSTGSGASIFEFSREQMIEEPCLAKPSKAGEVNYAILGSEKVTSVS